MLHYVQILMADSPGPLHNSKGVGRTGDEKISGPPPRSGAWEPRPVLYSVCHYFQLLYITDYTELPKQHFI